jgi:signal transduction histidine kinase
MVIASILLSRKAAYLQATLAVLGLGLVASGEAASILPHRHVGGFLSTGSCLLTRNYLLAVLFVFTTTLYLTVFMATSIVGRLRLGEQELAVANTKLEAQDRLKSQYVLMVSHDLQSSLSTVQSCLDVVLSSFGSTLPEKPREMIARAEQRSAHLLHYVRDLLNLSRIRAAMDVVKETLDVSVAVTKAVDEWKSQLEEKRLQFSVETSSPSRVIANREAVEELLSNLLFNAIKYTPPGGKIRVSIRPHSDNGFIQVAIEDTGIGIFPEDISRVFDDFFRAKNAQVLDKNGTGLGLSIAKQAVEMHGGKIWVESRVGKGSVFKFTLPKNAT